MLDLCREFDGSKNNVEITWPWYYNYDKATKLKIYTSNNKIWLNSKYIKTKYN